MPLDKLPQVPFGAVYFRKSNPPREDWDRDYGVAAEDGMNVFRHWFMWSAIERKPGVYDWEDYDRQMDLAAKNFEFEKAADLRDEIELLRREAK